MQSEIIYNGADFEIVCKNALIDILKREYDESHKIEDFDLTWFNYTLQHYKAMLIDHGPNQRYYECTYNTHKNQLYVDIYEKQSNTILDGKNGDFNHGVK